MLAIMGGVCVAVTIYFAAILPLQTYRESAEAGFTSARALYQEVSAAAAALERQSTATPIADAASQDQPVRVIASASAQELGLSITRIQPVSDGELSFWFDGAGVRDIFRWMVGLGTGHGLTIAKADIQKSPNGQTVQAQVVLRRNP